MSIAEVPQVNLPDSQVGLNVGTLQGIKTRVDELDKDIQKVVGGEDAKRSDTADAIYEENKETAEANYKGLAGKFNTMEPTDFIALVVAFEDEFMNGEIRAKFNQLVDEQIKVRSTSEEVLDLATLKDERKKQADLFRNFKGILESFKIDVSGVEDIPRSPRSANTGATKKTGGNKEEYRYSVNGEKQNAANNVFSAIVYQNTEGYDIVNGEIVAVATPEGGKPKHVPTRDLKTLMLKADPPIKFGETKEWSYTLPNGKTISARKFTDEDRDEFGLLEDSTPVESTNGTSDTTEGTEVVAEPTANPAS